MQSTASDWGPIFAVSRIVGTEGMVWTEGDTVRVAGPSGSRKVDVPEDLVTDPPEPPPADLLLTEYDLLHSTGIDLGPYTRLAGVFRDLILGRPVPGDPPPATFVDGVANMVVIDAIRQAAAEQRWVAIS
jgi:predicted dehydrogenase